MCGGSEVVVFSPNRGCTVDVYCRKYTMSHWRVRRRAWQLSRAMSLILRRSRRRSGSSLGIVAVAVEGTVLQAFVAERRGSSRRRSCSGQGPGRVRGSRPCRSRVLQ